MRIEDHLKELEERLLDPTVRRNAALGASLLAEDFIEFGSSGRSFDKTSILEELKNEPTRPAPILSDFSARTLAPEVALVTYRTTRLDNSGQGTAHAWRSSIWVNRAGSWQMTFHQGTPIPPQA
jgi:hypothetical protein